MAARRTTRFACKGAVLALLASQAVALPAAPAGARGLPLVRAERVARQAVLADPSYREITSSRSPLETRVCWRAPSRAVRCSLYVVVPSPCALDPHAELCAQALWQRRWLVEVAKTGSASARGRILKITAAPAASQP